MGEEAERSRPMTPISPERARFAARKFAEQQNAIADEQVREAVENPPFDPARKIPGFNPAVRTGASLERHVGGTPSPGFLDAIMRGGQSIVKDTAGIEPAETAEEESKRISSRNAELLAMLAPRGGGEKKTTTISGVVGGKQALAKTEAGFRKLVEDQELKAKEQGFAVQEAFAQMDQTRAELAEQEKAYAEGIGSKGDAVHKRLKSLQSEVDQAQKELKKTDFKVLGTFDNVGKALVGIASVIQQGSAAILGKTPVGSILEKAVQMDLDVQRNNLAKRLNTMQISQKERDVALRQFEKIQDKKRNAMKNLAVMELSRAAAREQSVDKMFAISDKLAAVRGKALSGEVQARAQLATRFQTATQMVEAQSGFTKEQRISESTKAKVNAVKDVNAQIGTILNKMKDAGAFNPLAANLPTSKESRIKALVEKLGVALARASQPGKLSDIDVEIFQNILKDKRWYTRADTTKRLFTELEAATSSVLSSLRTDLSQGQIGAIPLILEFDHMKRVNPMSGFSKSKKKTPFRK